MDITITAVLFAVGLLLIVKGGDYFVDAAAWMAEVSGIPKLIVGATVVSFATTLPELLVSSLASMEGRVDMAIGNAVGSFIANIGLILAIALLWAPSALRRRDYFVKTLLMLGAALVLAVFSTRGELTVLPGALLLLLFAAAMWDNVSAARRSLRLDRAGAAGRAKPHRREIVGHLGLFAVGTVGVVLGAQLLVDNGGALARIFGIPERIIGLTLVAVGTSLPELVTTLTALAKKQTSLSVGNIVGANIIDLTLILPVSGLIYGGPLPIAAASARVDLPMCLLVGTVAMVPALITGKFHRWQGGLLLAIYGGYLFFTCVMG